MLCKDHTADSIPEVLRLDVPNAEAMALESATSTAHVTIS